MLKIDDRKAAVGEVHIDPLVGVGKRTFLVGASMIEASTHLLRRRASVNLLIGARDSTHCQLPAATEVRRWVVRMSFS